MIFDPISLISWFFWSVKQCAFSPQQSFSKLSLIIGSIRIEQFAIPISFTIQHIAFISYSVFFSYYIFWQLVNLGKFVFRSMRRNWLLGRIVKLWVGWFNGGIDRSDLRTMNFSLFVDGFQILSDHLQEFRVGEKVVFIDGRLGYIRWFLI